MPKQMRVRLDLRRSHGAYVFTKDGVDLIRVCASTTRRSIGALVPGPVDLIIKEVSAKVALSYEVHLYVPYPDRDIVYIMSGYNNRLYWFMTTEVQEICVAFHCPLPKYDKHYVIEIHHG